MEFVATPTFTKLALDLLEDDDYAKLQAALALRPDMGKVIPGSGGIRKARWAASGRGKRGGLRVIYYGQVSDDIIWMLMPYPKSEREDLSRDQVRQLKILVEEFLL